MRILKELLNHNNFSLLEIILVIVCDVVSIAVSFFATAGLLWVICWAFNLAWWSWKISLGVWVALLILSSTFKVVVK